MLTDILQSVLGLPSECIYQNIRRPCKLSFSCWYEGGKHVHGCGNNKWLFSCCIPDDLNEKLRKPNIIGYVDKNITPTTKVKSKLRRRYQKKNMLRRRTDNIFNSQVS